MTSERRWVITAAAEQPAFERTLGGIAQSIRHGHLNVRGVPSKTQIEVRCVGRGCFDGVLRRDVPDGSPSVSPKNSVPFLRGGATLEIRVLP